MTIAIGQHTYATTGAYSTATSVGPTASVTTSSGSAFVICVGLQVNGGQSVSGPIVDSLSNSYTLKESGSGYNAAQIYLCDVGATGGSGHNVSVSFSAATPASVFFIEVTGAASPSYDTGNNGSDTSGSNSTRTGASITTSAAGIVISFLAGYNGGESFTDSGSGFSILNQIPNTGGLPGAVVSTNVTSGSGTYQDTYVSTSTDYWGFSAIGLKQATGGTTYTLSGQTGTFTEGTVTRALAYAASGQTATFTEGTVGSNVAYTLSGQTITSSEGTITRSLAYSASGQTASFTEGTIVPAVAYGLNGQTATFTEGTISASEGGNVTLSLSGQTATFSEGTITAKTTYSVGGQTATFTEGAMSPGATYSLTGETATFSEGTISATDPVAPSALTWTFDQVFTFDSSSYTWDGYFPQSSAPTSYIAILGVAVFNVSAASAISQFEIFIGYAPFVVTGESISAAIQGGSPAANIMPNLVGLELYPAIALLQQLKIYVPAKIGYFGTFPITAVFVKSNLPPSTVTAQSLAEGLAAAPNTPITLTVSEFAVSVAFP